MSTANLKNIVVSPSVPSPPAASTPPSIHPQPLEDSEHPPNDSGRIRWLNRLSGFGVSLVAHLLLLLLLSLIAIGSGSGLLPQTLMISQSTQDTVEVVSTDSFELEAPQIEPEVAPQLEPEFKMEVDLKPLETTVAGETEAEVTQETVATESIADATDANAAPLSNLALSIQKRVSQAGGRQGEVQFALAWKNVNDVDLHVITPSGERISHLHKASQCRGMLDVDMNVRGESETPVENVRWLSGAPAGRYTVLINLFAIHRAPAGGRVYRGSEFQLLARLGQESHLESEVVNQRNQVAVLRFQYVPDSVPEVQRNQLLDRLTKLQADEEAAASRLLERAREVKKQQLRDQLLSNLIGRYPHTDSAIEAMQLLGGRITKSGL